MQIRRASRADGRSGCLAGYERRVRVLTLVALCDGRHRLARSHSRCPALTRVQYLIELEPREAAGLRAELLASWFRHAPHLRAVFAAKVHHVVGARR
jgi:hypothetical protein